MVTSPPCSISRVIGARSSSNETNPHDKTDPAQLGRSRPRTVLPHQQRRTRDGILSIPPNPRRGGCEIDEMRGDIESKGFGFAAAEIIATGECIGFVGVTGTEYLPFLPAGTLEIGWRLAPEFWGHGYVSEAARAWLAYGFETLGRDEIVSFAVRDNRRSTAVMERIGISRYHSRYKSRKQGYF